MERFKKWLEVVGDAIVDTIGDVLLAIAEAFND